MLSFSTFFFRPISTKGFGLMRIAWAFTAIFFFLGESQDYIRYYSESGFAPRDVQQLIGMNEGFSLLFWITSPLGVELLALGFLISALLMMLGIWPRITTIISVVLLSSFHTRNFLHLSGGDNVLNFLGLFLILSPGTSAYSLSLYWKTKSKGPTSKLTMPAWHYRLLLWQLIILYVTAGWDKMLGTLWRNGEAVNVIMHHPHFVRFPLPVMHAISYGSIPVTYATVVFEFSWILLLLPREFSIRYFGLDTSLLKRILLMLGLFFHGSILLFMDIGSFSAAMFTAYLGLLTDEDFAALRTWLKK